MKASGNALGSLLALALCAACTQVLDIQDARFDSSLFAGSGGVAVSTGGAASGGHQHSPGGDGPATDTTHGGSVNEPTGGKASGAAEAGAGGESSEELPVVSLCESYCDKVMTNCKGKFEQYRSFDQCVEVCKRMPAGSPGDENVNSVECRVRQADFAGSEPFVYCKSAGPLGAGKCSSNCVSYCALMQATCTPETTAGNAELSFYDSAQACLDACGAIPAHADDPTQYSSSTTAEPSCYVGNTVYCRAYHLTSALGEGAPDEHCPHAIGGDPCIEQ